MHIQPIKLTLLNHLFYYTEVSGGGTSASLTGGFIGDLALCYALRRQMSPARPAPDFRTRPEYSEIKEFGFYCTVAKPISIAPTESYVHNTLFTDGYPDKDCIEKSGQSSYKNYRQVQGIKLGSEFLAAVVSKEKMVLPACVRVGTGNGTLVKIEPYKAETSAKGAGKKASGDDGFWLNAFTLQTVFQNMDRMQRVLTARKQINFRYVLENYMLVKYLEEDDLADIFQPHFA